jgi:hypothetical protein
MKEADGVKQYCVKAMTTDGITLFHRNKVSQEE